MSEETSYRVERDLLVSPCYAPVREPLGLLTYCGVTKARRRRVDSNIKEEEEDLFKAKIGE